MDTFVKPMTKLQICKKLSITPYRFEMLKNKYVANVVGKDGNTKLYDYVQWLNIIDKC